MGKSEKFVSRSIEIAAAGLAKLWRYAVGTYGAGRVVKVGPEHIGRRAIIDPRIVKIGEAGQPDFQGWRPVLITQEMVGRVIGQYVAPEIKREDGGVVSEAQAKTIAIMQRDGCFAGVFNDAEEFRRALEAPPALPLPRLARSVEDAERIALG